VVTGEFKIRVSFGDSVQSVSANVASRAGPGSLRQFSASEESSKWYVNIFVMLAKDIDCFEGQVKRANV
jgi:hypothetical protein